MINFTVGPVQSSDAVRAIGAEQVPYFRTAEFSEMMLENERLVKKFANATKDSKVVFMTCSGSGGMEAAIINCLTPQDKALVINGGSFGERFVELLTLHKIPFTEIKLKYGRALKPEHLAEYESKGYTTFLMQKHETSTGVHYDINLVSDFCKRRQNLSSFFCKSKPADSCNPFIFNTFQHHTFMKAFATRRTVSTIPQAKKRGASPFGSPYQTVLLDNPTLNRWFSSSNVR